MNYDHFGGQGGGQPDIIWPDDDNDNFAQHDAFFNDNIHGAKVDNKKGKKNDKAAKEKKPVVPIVPSYEGYIFTVLDPLRPGETASWVRTRRAQMHFNSQELYDKAIAHQKKSGLGLSGQFQALGPNQQTLVNRLVAEKNATEKESNAEWKLFGVRKNFEERRYAFKTLRVNNSIRVTIRRGDKAKDKVAEYSGGKIPDSEIDADNIVDLRVPVKKEEKKEDKKDGSKKKKKDAGNPNNDQQFGDPFANHDFAPHVELPPYPDARPSQDNWSNQAQPGDSFNMHEMSGGLPNPPPPPGAIPIPAQHFQPDIRPEAPMPPPPPHFPHEQHPFQPDPRVFPQAQPYPFEHFDERQPRNPVAYGQQHISARRPSHSRQPSHTRRRDSVDSDRLRAKEARKIADALRDEVRDEVRDIRDEVRDEIRGALRDAAAEDKVLHRWPTSGSGSASSSRSTAQDDFWSNAGSSGNRRFSNSTPGTSPDRGERYQRERPTFHRRDSSGARPYFDERKRYHMDRNRDYVIKPHDSRDIRYPRDRRQSHHDDYPTAQRLRSRERQYERPRIQRRVTDFPDSMRDADFRRPERGIDYERTRMDDRRAYGYDRDDRRAFAYEERRGGRERQPTSFHR